MTKVLFVGLGSMGGPMARRLLGAGHDVVGFDVDPARVEEHVAAGGSGVADPARGAATCEVVMSMVPADAHLRAVALGDDGVVKGLRPGTTYLDFSTVSTAAFLEVAEAVERAGGHMVDVAVGPGPAAAAAGTLTLMAGGPEDALGEHRGLLDVLGQRVVWCGAPGAGKAVKIANNMVSGVAMLLNAEAMALAVAAGADPQRLADVMAGTAAGNVMGTQVFPERVFTRTLDFGFTLALMRKDLALAADLAAERGVPTLLAHQALESFTRACAEGSPDDDALTIVRQVEAAAGITIESR